MNKQKLLLTLLILLQSCHSIPDNVSKQCSPVFVYDNIGKILEDKSACLCRTYKFSKDYVGAEVGQVEFKPLVTCDRVVGWTPDEYVKVASYWEAVRSYFDDKTEEN
jgi:hypothetical protein